MNITSTRLNTPNKPRIEKKLQDSNSFSSAGDTAKDVFQRAATAIGDNPLRSIVTVANTATMIGTLSTVGSNSQNAQFSVGASAVMGGLQAIGGLGRGIDALANMGSGYTQFGMSPKTQAISAIGDLMSAAGQFALASGVTTPAAALLVGGNLVTNFSDFQS